jgi:hypothetical protein
MMTNSISETLSSDKFDAFLIILKYSTWFDRWKTKSTEERLQNGTFKGSVMKGREFSTAGVKGSYRLLFTTPTNDDTAKKMKIRRVRRQRAKSASAKVANPSP